MTGVCYNSLLWMCRLNPNWLELNKCNRATCELPQDVFIHTLVWKIRAETWCTGAWCLLPSEIFIYKTTLRFPQSVLHKSEVHLPVYAWHVDDDIYHVTAQLVALHVDGGAVSRDVDLTDNVKQKRLLDPRILKYAQHLGFNLLGILFCF